MPTPTIIKTLATHREKPFVSVVTPTWNRGAFLPYLLYMYRYQDYPADRRELIILDDSPQSHQHIIDRLTNGTPEAFNIRYIHHPEKLPLGKKRNMLNELARGEYILCMDDDDYYPAVSNLLHHRYDAKTPGAHLRFRPDPHLVQPYQPYLQSRSFAPT